MADDVADKSFRERCEYVFDLAFGGAHHIHRPKFVEDSHRPRCEFTVMGDLATWDYNTLTALVVAGHDAALRVGISNGGPRKLKVVLYARMRVHANATVLAHPTIEDHIALIRGHLSQEEFYARMRPAEASAATSAE